MIEASWRGGSPRPSIFSTGVGPIGRSHILSHCTGTGRRLQATGTVSCADELRAFNEGVNQPYYEFLKGNYDIGDVAPG